MAVAGDIDYCYEGSDEASESELLDQSLSLWSGWGGLRSKEEFAPIPLDLHTAASIGQYDCVRNIIERGEEDIDRKNCGGWTALMYACYIGHDTVVNLLLDKDVNINAKNNKGQTSLMLAACCGNESVAYFLLQAGAELEARDKKGWTALFHATYSGHQNMVRFLLETGADAESVEPTQNYTPFMEAAAAGHEIIVQCFLQHGVNVNAKSYSGDTAQTLALVNGYMKIVSLIESHLAGPPPRLRAEPGLNFDGDLSSSDEQYHHPRRSGSRPRTRLKGQTGPSIREGPEALTKLMSKTHTEETHFSQSTGSVPKGYMSFSGDHSATHTSSIRERDVTSPINNRDLDSSGGRESHESADYDEEANAFSRTGALTIKSSSCSSSSGGLAAALGLSRGNSLDSNIELQPNGPDPFVSEVVPERPPRPSSDPGQRSASCYLDDLPPPVKKTGVKFEELPPENKEIPSASKESQRLGHYQHQYEQQQQQKQQQQMQQPQQVQEQWQQEEQPKEFTLFPDPNVPLFPSETVARKVAPPGLAPRKCQPPDLPTLLRDLALAKYIPFFEEQDVDLQVFLSLTDSDLKEIGIKLFGPRRKMTNAIARWHSETWSVTDPLEKVYADRLEAEMQEMAIQLHQAYQQTEVLKQQVLQERELRSVTEGCLMEERRSRQQKQRLALDTRQRCVHMQQTLWYTRLFHQELCHRLGTDSELQLSGSSDSLTLALRESLSLEDNLADGPNASIPDLSGLSLQAIMRKLIKYREELGGSVSLSLINSDKLLDREIEFPPKTIDKFS